MKHGTRPTKADHRDYGYFQTFGAIAPDRFPDDYSTDANLWMPSQNAYEPTFDNPPLPYGCTDYTQADLANDEAWSLRYDPITLENKTHANALGGYEIRKSLDAARKLGWFTAYFNIQSHGLDMFDSVRLAMMSGYPEKRSVSVGTPWYAEFENTITKNADGSFTASALPSDWNGILQEPHNYDPKGLGWHNWKVSGWKTINGIPYLIGKSWQGNLYGDNGNAYLSRALFNQMMSISGTCAYTASSVKPDTILKIDLPYWKYLWSYLRTLVFSY